ncbi:MAG: proprotein convertase P-domain-containing protein [Bacteroidota bacterium]|nr:MAG: proprotein convertase P-domain-containing protein [Bacteroidota bacterium]
MEVRGEQVYSNSIPVNIPDNTLVSSSITIPTGNPVNNISNTTYIDVRINISHPNVSDLKIYLVAPNNCGTLELSTNNGGNGDDYINTILTSTAIQNITIATAPFSNTFYLAEGVTHSPSGISYQAPTGLTGIFPPYLHHL